VNFFGEGTLILSLGGPAGPAGSGGGLLGPPRSDILSESLLLSELLGSSAGVVAVTVTVLDDPATVGALLDTVLGGDSGNPPGVTLAAFASSLADSDSVCCALSLASCLAGSSIENCSFGGAFMNRPLSSLARCCVPFLGGLLLPLGSWGSSILITC